MLLYRFSVFYGISTGFWWYFFLISINCFLISDLLKKLDVVNDFNIRVFKIVKLFSILGVLYKLFWFWRCFL